MIGLHYNRRKKTKQGNRGDDTRNSLKEGNSLKTSHLELRSEWNLKIYLEEEEKERVTES